MRANSGYKLKQMQKRLEDMFSLLSLWQQYVDIIYAPEQEINLLKRMKDAGTLGADLSQTSFATKLENANIEKKLAELFAADDSAALDEELADMAAKNAEEAYLSVQEGLTSDTSITSEGPEADFVRRDADLDSSEEPQPNLDDTGVQSSDEEQAAAGDETTAQPQDGELKFSQRKLFGSERDREKHYADYNLDDTEVNRFKAKMQRGFDDEVSKKGGQSIVEDVDYIAQEQDVKASANIQQLNLFGTPLASEQTSTKKEKNANRRFVQELVDALVALDPDNALMDLEQPSTFIQFNPMDEDPETLAGTILEQQAQSLRYEDNVKMRASLVLEAYSRQLEEINVKSLSQEEKDRLEKVTMMVEFLKQVKVVDAAVLLKLYNMYSVQAEFEY